MKQSLSIPFVLFFASILFVSCEGGLEPPMEESNPTGVISGKITYSGEWPPEDSLKDLRFVALKSKPQSAADIVSVFPDLPFSQRLKYNVERDSFRVDNVRNGVYVYNAIAQQFGDQILQDWKPVGLYMKNNGIIIIDDNTVSIEIEVDFDNPPPFPPE
ncbi:MAG: hypothetical protein U5K72_06150 [Balneolaceae bacterium]|nr:hypothetical protein [Balneolaceae bacterium]